jgi:sulfonate transport system permease protein
MSAVESFQKSGFDLPGRVHESPHRRIEASRREATAHADEKAGASLPAQSSGLRRSARAILVGLLPWAFPIAVLVVWEAGARLGLISPRLLPAPSAVASAFWETARSGVLLHHMAVSTGRALQGLAIGGGIGFAMGVLNGLSRPAEALLDSSMQMLRNVPHLAMIPLVILWFGIGEEAKIFLVAVGVAFPIYLNTFHGIRTVDRGLIEMARVYGASRSALCG